MSLSLFLIVCAKIQRHKALEANTKYVFRGHDFCSMECGGSFRCFDVKKSDGGIFYEHHDDQVKVSVFKLRLMIKALFFQSEDFRSCMPKNNFFTMRSMHQ